MVLLSLGKCLSTRVRNLSSCKIPWRVRDHETGLSGWKCSFFPTSNIYITLYFNVSNTLLRKNRNAHFLYICIYIYIYIRFLSRTYFVERSTQLIEEHQLWLHRSSGFTSNHRFNDKTKRTGNFLPGGAVNHLPKKFSQVSQIFTKESKRNEGHIATT